MRDPAPGRGVLVLSPLHVAPLLAARARGAATARVSPDLGMSQVQVRLESGGARFPPDEFVPWETLAAIKGASGTKRSFGSPCYVVRGADASRVTVYSQTTGRVCSLAATAGAPTIVLAGFPMHRTKGVDPLRDTVLKVRTIAPLVGPVLDTATGLGYTAIEAARTASHVVTVEIDPGVLAVARLNPWSRPLFESKAITQVIGDSTEVVTRFADESFARVIHDPPTLSLAGDLYSTAFYTHLNRLLQRGGRLFHYVGDFDSGLGHRVAGGVMRRMRDAGFARIHKRPEAFGIVAVK